MAVPPTRGPEISLFYPWGVSWEGPIKVMSPGAFTSPLGVTILFPGTPSPAMVVTSSDDCGQS